MINADKPLSWIEDMLASVDMYNDWFMVEAPKAYRDSRLTTTKTVKKAMLDTSDFLNITSEDLKQNPRILRILRMATAPPLAVDRIAGLSHTKSTLIQRLEEGKLPIGLRDKSLDEHLSRICTIIERLLDHELFRWLRLGVRPSTEARNRAATVLADRLCGSLSDPIIRNAQEARQLALIEQFVTLRGYIRKTHPFADDLKTMQLGTYSFHTIVLTRRENGQTVRIPVDVAIMPFGGTPSGYPILIEAKSAGDFTNTNKRRKEESDKVHQLRRTYGVDIKFILFLCGYFPTTYLGYEAAEGIDWIWEHRVADMEELGI